MAETLLSLSKVLLYGRVLGDLKIEYTLPVKVPVPDWSDREPPLLGNNNFLHSQLSEGLRHAAEHPDDPPIPPDPVQKARFARIYGFSFEGHYYDLAKPAIFLVHGEGTLAEGPLPSTSFESQRWTRAPSSAERTGQGSQAGSFANDMRVWSYDKADFSIRLDSMTGPLDQILLDEELSGDRLKTQIGAAAMMRMRATRGPAED